MMGRLERARNGSRAPVQRPAQVAAPKQRSAKQRQKSVARAG
jgi:hypothetical protein